MRRKKWKERQERNREERQMESELGRQMGREREWVKRWTTLGDLNRKALSRGYGIKDLPAQDGILADVL